MDLQSIIDNLSDAEALDFKELIPALFGGNIDMETIYTQIKDTL